MKKSEENQKLTKIAKKLDKLKKLSVKAGELFLTLNAMSSPEKLLSELPESLCKTGDEFIFFIESDSRNEIVDAQMILRIHCKVLASLKDLKKTSLSSLQKVAAVTYEAFKEELKNPANQQCVYFPVSWPDEYDTKLPTAKDYAKLITPILETCDNAEHGFSSLLQLRELLESRNAPDGISGISPRLRECLETKISTLYLVAEMHAIDLTPKQLTI